MIRTLALVGAVACIALGAYLRPPLPGMPLRDFEAYYAAGAAWNASRDPYARELWVTQRLVPGVDGNRDELLPFVGPPFTLPVFGALARLPFADAKLVWYAILSCALAALALGSLWLAIGQRRALDLAAATALALAFAPVTGGFALGQNALVAAGAVVATVLAMRIGARPAGVTVFVAAFQPNIAIGLLPLLRESRGRVALTLGIGAAGVLSFFAVGPERFAQYGSLLGAHAAAERCADIQVTSAAIACGLGAGTNASLAVGVMFAACAIALVAYALVSNRYDWLTRVAVTCAALPFIAPFGHEHDLAIVFFPAMLAVRRAIRWLWFASALGIFFVAVDWLGLAQRPGSTAEATLLAVATMLAVIALTPRRLRAGNAIPLLLALIVLALAPLASAHPVPVWPDALPAAFHAPAAETAAQVWHAELLATGTLERNPVSALLRACSLAGCALILGSALAALRRQRGLVPLEYHPDAQPSASPETAAPVHS